MYRIQKGVKTKVKVVHHDQLKPYRCRDPLDNAWAVEHARRWTPTEVSAPALDMDPADPTLGLSQLFTDTDAAAEEGSSCTPSDPEVETVAAALSVPSTPPDSSAPEDIQVSGGSVAEQHRRSHHVPGPRTGRNRGPPVWYGEWVRT